MNEWIEWRPTAGFLAVERALFEGLARYFRLELLGGEHIPDWGTRPCLFVMNHTAVVGLEVYLLHAALGRLRPSAPHIRTTVWPPFLQVPGLGGWYRAGGCLPMSVELVAGCLRGGQSVLVLPEGPDATDVRDEVGPFHGGFLRALREVADLGVPVVPLGWAGVDEAMQWFVLEHPLAVRALMKPIMPKFDFALLPRPPLLRPSKVVLCAGPARTYDAASLGDEESLRRELAAMRRTVIDLVAAARQRRAQVLEASPLERKVHRWFGAGEVSWRRR